MESLRKKRKRKREYEPNAQECRANAAHMEIQPILRAALVAYETWMKRRRANDPSGTEDRDGTEGTLVMTAGQRELGMPVNDGVGWVAVGDGVFCCEGEGGDDPKEGSGTGMVDWLALEKMKRVVKPKLHRLDNTGTEQGQSRLHFFCFLPSWTDF